jgi:hypothetical protein
MLITLSAIQRTIAGRDARSSAARVCSQHSANAPPQLVFPHRAKVFPAQDRARYPLPLLHRVAAVLRLPQVAQLRRDACRRVMRQLGQLLKRQPRFALPRAQHYVAEHVALSSPNDALKSPTSRFSHYRLLSRRDSLFSGDLFFERRPRLFTFLIVRMIRRPSRAVRVLVIAGAGAACTHRPPLARGVARKSSDIFSASSSTMVPSPAFSTVFPIITHTICWTLITVLLLYGGRTEEAQVICPRTQPPWEFLLSASRNSLQSYELSRLSHASNLRKEIAALLDQWMEENSAAMLARWLIEQRERPPLAQETSGAGELPQRGHAASDNVLPDRAISPPANCGPA